MASQKAASSKPTTTEEKDIFAEFMPAGWDSADNRKVGGLDPIYAFKGAYEQKWPPVIGLMVGIELLDMGVAIEDPKQRHREFLRVELKTATKGVLGSNEKQEVVECAVGSDILIPMSGAIKNIKTIRTLIGDVNNVYLGCFMVTGQLPLNQPGKPTPMWQIDARINNKAVPREGRFNLPAGGQYEAVLAAKGGGVTSTGVRYDEDGAVVSAQA